jgi:hypothetical protein
MPLGEQVSTLAMKPEKEDRAAADVSWPSGDMARRAAVPPTCATDVPPRVLIFSTRLMSCGPSKTESGSALAVMGYAKE